MDAEDWLRRLSLEQYEAAFREKPPSAIKSSQCFLTTSGRPRSTRMDPEDLREIISADQRCAADIVGAADTCAANSAAHVRVLAALKQPAACVRCSGLYGFQHRQQPLETSPPSGGWYPGRY